MDRQTAKPTREQFLAYIREALQHLYDPARLRASPLAAIFGVVDRYETAPMLRRILTEAIGSLAPEINEPSQSRGRRLYDVLVCRYMEQLRPQEIAIQLNLSPRQLRREHHDALEVLTGRLWQQFDVSTEPALQAGPANAQGQSRLDRAELNHELSWLRDVSQDSSTDPDQVLPDVLRWTEQLAAVHRVQLEIALASASPKLAVHSVALRQILLNLLNVVIPRASAGRVDISSRTLQWDVEFRVHCSEYPSGPKPALDDEEESLLIAHQLADLCGCTLVVSADARAFDATLGVPRIEQLPVLVVDDNVDALQLFQRYATGSRYRLFTTRDPKQVVSLIEKLAPQIIVLDVMMPQLDGWKLLEQLRHHPLTADLPTIVCTILPHEELGLLLGANDFVRKPVSRQDFLSALDNQVMRMRSGSH